MRSRGTTRCTPFDARTRNGRTPAIPWISSVQTPVAETTCCARIVELLTRLAVDGLDADDASALARRVPAP